MISRFNYKAFINSLSYKNVLLIIFVCCFFYILPVIIANTFYIDDMNRTTIGYNWNRDGRFMSSILMHFLSNQIDVVYSFFPYSTIFSTFLLALTGFLLSYILKIRDKLQLILSSLIFVTCPFLLEILTYKFDCLPISLSVFCAVLPFTFYKNRWKFFISSALFLFLIFGFYQTTAFSYVIILCIFLIKDNWSNNYKRILTNSILAFLAFIAAFLIYQICIKIFHINLVDAQRSEFIFGHLNFRNLLLERWDGFKNLFFTLIKSSYIYSLLIFMLVAGLGVCSFFTKQKLSQTLVFQVFVTILLVTIVLLLAVSINLVVMEPRWSPRSLIGFSFVLLMLFYAIIQIPQKAVFNNCLACIPLLFYSFLITSQLGIFLKNQDEYSDFIISLMAPEILKYNDLKLVIDGSVKYAPRNATVNYDRMQFIYKLAPLYEHYSFYWGVIRLNKFEMASNEYVFGEEREKVLKEKENFPVIQKNKIYTLRIQEPYAIIQFH